MPTTQPANWFLPTERVVTPVPVVPQPTLPVSVLIPWRKDGAGERRMIESAFQGGHRTLRFKSQVRCSTILDWFLCMEQMMRETLAELQSEGEELKLLARIAVRFIKRDQAAEQQYLQEHGVVPPPLKEEIAWISHAVLEVLRESPAGPQDAEKIKFLSELYNHFVNFVEGYQSRSSGWMMVSVEQMDWAIVKFQRL